MMAGVSTQVDVGNPNDRDWRYLSALISMDGTPDAISRQFALHESNYAFFQANCSVGSRRNGSG